MKDEHCNSFKVTWIYSNSPRSVATDFSQISTTRCAAFRWTVSIIGVTTVAVYTRLKSNPKHYLTSCLQFKTVEVEQNLQNGFH